MRTIIDEDNKKYLEFNYSEFVDNAQNRKRSNKARNGGHKDSRTGNKSFCGTKDFDEAMELARGGWDSGLEQLKLDEGVLMGAGVEVEQGVVGSVVNMGAYLTGQPNNMINFREHREYNLDELTIYAPLVYSAYNGIKEALKFCQSTVKIINKYQSKKNVKLVGVFDSRNEGVRYRTEVLIKDFDQRFVLNNVAFAFHPSFFRRLWFSQLESERFVDDGYGSTNDGSKIRSMIKEQHTRGEYIITPCLNDLSGGSFEESQCFTK